MVKSQWPKPKTCQGCLEGIYKNKQYSTLQDVNIFWTIVNIFLASHASGMATLLKKGILAVLKIYIKH